MKSEKEFNRNTQAKVVQNRISEEKNERFEKEVNKKAMIKRIVKKHIRIIKDKKVRNIREIQCVMQGQIGIVTLFFPYS